MRNEDTIIRNDNSERERKEEAVIFFMLNSRYLPQPSHLFQPPQNSLHNGNPTVGLWNGFPNDLKEANDEFHVGCLDWQLEFASLVNTSWMSV